MNTIFLGIVIFLCVLAIFDLVVGVSNDAVNFLNSAIGAKVAKFRTIVLIAAIGVFAGAAMSNGMMDVARHGIMTPEHFSYYEVMCVFLAVMVTDVILLDIFNTLGMPTSTTVSMVFELLGGAFAISLLKLLHGTTTADGTLLTLGDLLNTEKAISVILGIFLSVAIAFVAGMVVMWVSRIIFTYRSTPDPSRGGMGVISFAKQTLFGGVCITSIVWFLLINGLKGSSLMTPEVKLWISANTWMMIGVIFGVAFLISALLYLLPRPLREGARGEWPLLLKFVVLLGTFALAMAFAGNDLVNFVGVPLTGLEAYQDYMANGNGDPDAFMMKSLMDSAHTPVIYLILAGIVMVLSLIFSKKAQNVVKTSVDLSRQDDGDEMFGSSPAARTLVRQGNRMSTFIERILPDKLLAWIDSRFTSYKDYGDAKGDIQDAPAFDLIRASVNLVLAGLLVAIGTSLKLPLSTTYVTFMVAMGTSLADRAWGRESAVFHITGVLSVIGGWFITAGAAFIFCFLLTNLMHFGGYIIMGLSIVLAIYLLIRSNMSKTKDESKAEESLFIQILKSKDRAVIWSLLCEHIRMGNAARLRFVIETYDAVTKAFLREQYQPLRRASSLIDEERKALKRQRKREIVTMQKLTTSSFSTSQPAPLGKMGERPFVDPSMGGIGGGITWYFLGINSCQQMLYSLKRINEPVREHVGNSFSPMPEAYHERFIGTRETVLKLYGDALKMLETGDFTNADALRERSAKVQQQISKDRKQAIDSMQDSSANLTTLLLTIHILQESQELVGQLRHMIRGMNKFAGAEG